MPPPSTPHPNRKGRLVDLLTRVEPGELPVAAALGLNIFILLTAYYILKPVREGLILSLGDSGPELKSYASGAIALLMFGVVPLYGAIASRVQRNRLIVGVTLFFASNLVVFHVLGRYFNAQSWLGFPYFLWLGVFNMMIVSQFWAFANDIYTEEQGKRLFALIGVGASVGAILGSKIAGWLLGALGIFGLLLVAAGLLVLSAAIVQWVHSQQQQHAAPPVPTTEAPAPATAKSVNGITMVFRSRYLFLMAAFTLVFTVVNTNGEYMLGRLVADAAHAKVAAGELAPGDVGNEIAGFYTDFFFYVNTLGLLIQAFLVSRIVRWGGIKLALLAVPVLALGTWSIAAALPVLAVLSVTKTADNAADYSLNNTARQMLWLPTTAAEKYNAKQAIDTFFVRLGDVGSAGLVFVFATVASVTSLGLFAGFNVALVVLWLWIARKLLAAHGVLTRKSSGSDSSAARP